jgi:cupin fold WbuC family metalloprotein
VIRTTPFNEEVRFTTQDLTAVTAEEIGELKAQAQRTHRRRLRLCTHPHPDAPVHEMLIVHPKDAYVRPHKHLNKDESLHLIEGAVTAVIFEEDGAVYDVLRMGPYASGRPFYYRLLGGLYHTLLIESDVVVFHEVIRGPFRPPETVLAPWAPQEQDASAVARFLEELRTTLDTKRRADVDMTARTAR